jgi:Flp pilus assembly protein TadG
MRNLIGSRRGASALVTVVALTPLIGFMALGAEAGSWYVIKRHAQNAADAAAYAGALELADSFSGQSGHNPTSGGKLLAAQNAFCNTGDTSYTGSKCSTNLPSGTTQSVAIATGDWAGGAFTTPPANNGNAVRAQVSQTQPGYLAGVVGLKTVTILSQAIAQVYNASSPCVLALQDSITFQGSITINSPNCGIQSNSTAGNSVTFTGNSPNVSNVQLISGTGGCSQTAGSYCTNVLTYIPPAVNPLSALDSAMSGLSTNNFPDGKCTVAQQPIAYDSTKSKAQCYNTSLSGNLKGVYFFSGNINVNSNSTIQTTGNNGATLIFLPGSSLSITGTPNIQLNPEGSVATTQVPAALASAVGLLSDLLIYDPEAYSNKGVNISGNSSSYFNGAVYVPNSPVTFQGASSNATCGEIVAYAVTWAGNPYFNNSGCPQSLKIQSQIVRLVQ